MIRWLLPGLALIFLASADRPGKLQVRPESVAVLAGDELRLVSTRDWNTIWSLTLVDVADRNAPISRRVQARGDTLFVLTMKELLGVDRKSGRIVARQPLPKGDFRTISVHSSEPQFAICGNDGLDAVFLMRTVSGTLAEVGRVRSDSSQDWRIYQCSWSNRGSRLFVSYHGSNTTGVDWFDMRQGILKRCANRSRASTGCMGGHGGFIEHGGRLLIATGGARIISAIPNGKTADAAGLGNLGHLMEFQVSRDGGQLYAAGACNYATGFDRADLKTHSVTSFRDSYRSHAGRFCSDQLTILDDSTVLSIEKYNSNLDMINVRTAGKSTRVKMHGDLRDVYVF